MKNRIGLLILSIVLVLAVLVGSTYSLVFKVDETDQQSYSTGELSVVSMATNGEPSFNLNNSLPMSDDDGASSTPYMFKVTNTGSVPFKFNIKLMSTDDISDMISSEYIKLKINDSEVKILSDLVDGNILEDVILAPGVSMEFSLRVWLSENIPNTQIGKVFNAKITTEGYSVVVPAYVTLNNLGLTDNIKFDKPNFYNVSYSNCDTSENAICEETVGIYSAQDDLGTSYYFRGDIDYNYVKFGKTSSGADMYWRIIRINGDGTIRMIYDGTSAYENGNVNNGTNRHVATMAFNSVVNDNAYAGYMYGLVGMNSGTDDVDKCLIYNNSTSSIENTIAANSTKTLCESAGGTWTTTAYEATHANLIDSTVKNYLEDTWYSSTLKKPEYEKYIADAIYCNDRGLDTSNASYTGVGTTKTDYAANQRFTLETLQPKLTCTNVNDRFTLNKDNFDIETNGMLNEPVGLITADELTFAGSRTQIKTYDPVVENLKYYLHTGISFWTMTPFSFYTENSIAGVRGFFEQRSSGKVAFNTFSQTAGGIRPVISLKNNALIYNEETSNGSREYPFVVE